MLADRIHELFSPKRGDHPAISVRGLEKEYRIGKNLTVNALRGIDFEVAPGEYIAICGPSGCGKTTLLNLLSGLDVPTGGEILIDGVNIHQDLSDNKLTDLRRDNIGLIFQFYNLIPVLSAVENVELPLLLKGTKAKVARAKALEKLEQVGLDKWAKHKPDELSGGQRQRVAIARALINDPTIVLADELTGALDSKTAEEVISVLEDLNREMGHTILVVTHDLEVSKRANRLLEIRDGKIVNDVLQN
ncbi:MAG: ABC transporter ATP-binding protein [Promethearchaeota archaeon]